MDVLLKRVVAELQPVVLKSVFSGTKRHVGLRGLGVFPVVVAVLLLLVSAGAAFQCGAQSGVSGGGSREAFASADSDDGGSGFGAVTGSVVGSFC